MRFLLEELPLKGTTKLVFFGRTPERSRLQENRKRLKIGFQNMFWFGFLLPFLLFFFWFREEELDSRCFIGQKEVASFVVLF
jgi:hypothetical protein